MKPQRSNQSAAFCPYISLGILGKSLMLLVIYGHWLAGNIGWSVLVLVLADGVFIALLLNFLRRYPA